MPIRPTWSEAIWPARRFEFGFMLRGQRVARVEEQHGGSDGTGALGTEAVVNFWSGITELIKRGRKDDKEYAYPDWGDDGLPTLFGFGPTAKFPSHEVFST